MRTRWNFMSGCLSLGIFAAMVNLSCRVRSVQNQSDLDVANGVRITEGEFPATIRLAVKFSGSRGSATQTCTATFINHRQAITAAHCTVPVNGQAPTLQYVTHGGANGGMEVVMATAQSAHVHQHFTMDGPHIYDLAILNFPDNTAPAVAAIAVDPPAEARAGVTIVGYGVNHITIQGQSHSGTGAGFKRKGFNQISRRGDGIYEVVGVSKPGKATLGQQSVSGPGDSGGALYYQNQLIGIVESGSTVQVVKILGRFVDLTTATSKEFLQRFAEAPDSLP